MITTIDHVEYIKPAAAAASRYSSARTSHRLGRACAAWYFSAFSDVRGQPGLNPKVLTEGYMGPFMAPWLACLSRVGKTLPLFEDVVYHMPYGADPGNEMPFEAQIMWSRYSRLRRSFPTFLEETGNRTWHITTAGILPTVYLGGLSSRSYWNASNLHWSVFADQIETAIDGLVGPAGMPLCRIAGDTWGVRGYGSAEDLASQILRRAAFDIVVEPRPAVWTMWATSARCASLTTDQLFRNTGEGGTGVGGDWAVPMSQLSGPTGVLVIDDATTNEELAGWMARGVDIYFPGWAWCGNFPEATSILRRVETVRARAQQIMENGDDADADHRPGDAGSSQGSTPEAA